MDSFSDLAFGGRIDYASLPYDCLLSAAERMRRDLGRTGCCDSRDSLIVLGSQTESVDMSWDREYMGRQFLRRVSGQ